MCFRNSSSFRKPIFYCIVIVSLIAIYIYNMLTPLMSDDDVDENADYWGNWIYTMYYDLDNIVGIPREEWTAY